MQSRRTILLITEVRTHSVANCVQLFRMTQQFCGQKNYQLLQITQIYVHSDAITDREAKEWFRRRLSVHSGGVSQHAPGQKEVWYRGGVI